MPLSKARFCSVLLACSAWAVPALADPQVTLVATPTSPQVGSGVDLSVLISGVTDLYGYNFSLSFDASLLQVTGISEGSFLGSAGSTYFDGGSIDNGAGTISYLFDTLIGAVPGASGSGTLVTIHLNAIGTGTSALTFASADTMFVDSNLGAITVQMVDGSLQVAAAVPEPSSYLMLAAGLAGICAWRRRHAA